VKRLAVLALWVSVLTEALPAAAAETVRYKLQSEIGLEYDTNPGRQERVDNDPDPAPITPSPGGRLVVGGLSTLKLSSKSVLIARLQAAARGFSETLARKDSVGIVQGSLALATRFGVASRARLSLSLYDAYQEDQPGARAFRSVLPRLQLSHGLPLGVVNATAGYRWFEFKPESAFSFSGPRASVAWQFAKSGQEDPETYELGADWLFSLTASYERRGFRRLFSEIDPDSALSSRTDNFLGLLADTSRTTDFLIGGGFGAFLNDSNSRPDGLVRFFVYVKGAVLLPLDITASWRAELLYTSYAVPLTLARDPVTGTARTSLDDENRNTVRLELARPVAAGWRASLRAILYTNELGTGPVRYRRQSLLLSAVYDFDSAAQ